MVTINPYLSFKDNCEEAFHFYKSVFGGEFSNISRFKDAPKMEGFEIGPADSNKIMHMALPIGKTAHLMGSDSPSHMDAPVSGTNMSVSVHPQSEDEAKRIFEGISKGGTIIMPMAKTFWGAWYGMCIDKFGVQWMVNYQFEELK